MDPGATVSCLQLSVALNLGWAAFASLLDRSAAEADRWQREVRALREEFPEVKNFLNDLDRDRQFSSVIRVDQLEIEKFIATFRYHRMEQLLEISCAIFGCSSLLFLFYIAYTEDINIYILLSSVIFLLPPICLLLYFFYIGIKIRYYAATSIPHMRLISVLFGKDLWFVQGF
jgi:hypothetical protein